MDIYKTDLNLLVVLEAIYSEGGLTRAGERLGVTQPAVSHSLGRLRELLGDPLFLRKGHAMVPTPFTRSLIGPLRRTLRGMETMLNEIERFDPALAEKRFTLGCRDPLESRILPRLIRMLAPEAPHIEIATVHYRRREAEADLLSGRLDAITDLVLPRSEDIRHRRVSSDRLAVVARGDHPRIRGELSLSAYLQEAHILVSSRPSGPAVEDFELNRHNLERRVYLRCQHHFAATQVVQETDLLLTLPERLARLLNADTGNQVLPFPLDVPAQDLYLCWHASVDNDPANQWLREQLLKTFAEAEAGPT